MYALRSIGGTLYLIGVFMMAWNLWKTAAQGSFLAEEEVEVPEMPRTYNKPKGEFWHRPLERRPIQFMIVALIMVIIGGVIELVPTFLIKSNIPTISSVQPYTPLELQGRDIYVREGCYTCHSQMVRPFRDEVARYGEYSEAGEFVYDHPFQWGSKRTGPDLAREGVGRLKKTDSWHYNHFLDPRLMSPGSIMPSYVFLLENTLDTSSTAAKISAMRTIGVPYPEGYEQIANKELMTQANGIRIGLKMDKIETPAIAEVVALIAYLQRLGKDISTVPKEPTASK